MLKLPEVLSQRDSRWSSILLGNNTSLPYTIGNYGCLLTCLSCYSGILPNQANDTLKQGGGFAANSGEFIWSKVTLLGLNQTYLSPRWDGIAVTPQGIQKAKDSIDAGFPPLLEIDFNPATNAEEMHFVLAIAYSGDTFTIFDPWTGTIVSLDIYGGFARAVIQYRTFDKLLSPDVPVVPASDEDTKVLSDIKSYRTDPSNKQGQEGSFEGFAARLIGHDRDFPGLQADSANAQQAVRDIQGQLDGANAAVGSWEDFQTSLWKILNVSGTKNPAAIISAVQELITNEDNNRKSVSDAQSAQKQLSDFYAKLSQVLNIQTTDQNTILGAIQALKNQIVDLNNQIPASNPETSPINPPQPITPPRVVFTLPKWLRSMLQLN